MSDAINHIICTQRLDVQFYGTEQQGLQFQNRIAEYCSSGLMTKLEARFDRIAPQDHYISIDRLEVEVSGYGNPGLDDRFADVLASEVMAAIEEKIARNVLVPGTRDNNVPTTGKLDIKVYDHAQHAADMLIYFIGCGRLPWNVRLPQGLSLERYLVEKIPDLHLYSSHTDQLQKLMARTDARKRMIHTFTPAFVQQLFSLIPSPQHQVILEHLTSEEKTKLFGHPQMEANSTVQHAQSNIDKQPARPPNQQPIVATSKPLDNRDTHTGRIDLPGEGIFIGNSGLVLFHPFLPQLFETLQLVHENKLAAPGTALQVLHYICTGQRMVAEYDLVLPKVLCGLPVDAFVEMVDPLRDDQCDEIARMMQAVIQHWSALRNTSIAGLQETFLQRAGKLMWNTEKGWELLVEVKTFDILLDYVPWGLSRIRLPWMNELLQVRWDHQQLS